MPKLGRRMWSQNFALRGRLTSEQWEWLLRDCALAMGMTPAGHSAKWSYPTHDGKGGFGTTICQPMTESFIVIDTWPDHDGAYLHVASCQKFDPASLISPARRAGIEIGLAGQMEMLRL